MTQDDEGVGIVSGKESYIECHYNYNTYKKGKTIFIAFLLSSGRKGKFHRYSS